ncbi:unnamed protein product [Rhodiola kirilowii]
MNEELDRQVLLMDESDTKVDRTTADLKNTNVRLKETLFKVRSTRNFIIDIILLCVLLGIVAILQNFFFASNPSNFQIPDSPLGTMQPLPIPDQI